MPEDYTAENAALEDIAEVGTAADIETTENLEINADDVTESPVEAANIDPKKAQTKAYSERLNAERERIRQQERDALIAEAGFYDEHGKKMNTRAEYDAWRDRKAEAERTAQFFSSYEDDPASAITKLLDEKLSTHPAIIEAKRLQAEAYWSKQISALNQVYPDSGINTAAEYMAHPKFKIMDAMMSADQTVSILDAYQAAHFKELSQRKTAAAKQAALTSEANRSHLKGTSGSGGEQANVPNEIMGYYKSLNPRATDKEIREHYARSQKG